MIPIRNRPPLLVFLCSLAFAVAGCGGDTDTSTDTSELSATSNSSNGEVALNLADSKESSPPTSTASAAESSQEVASVSFPVTVEHAFGSTTIEHEPERIVSIGFTDHDVLLALGVKPVAVREWYGGYDFVWPWAEAHLGDHQPEIISSGALSFEQIASLDPDLIIGLQIGLDSDEYELLSQIAPTVAQSGDYPAWGAPWQVNTMMAGQAIGRSDVAAELIFEVESLLAATRSAHPDWEGLGLAYAGVYGSDAAKYYVETNGSTRMKVLQDLGFVVPEELAALGSDRFYHDISAEQIGLLEQDVVLWEPAVLSLLPAVEENELYRTLSVFKEDRDIFLIDPVIAGAMSHATVLSLPIVIEFLVPELERAVANLDSK